MGAFWELYVAPLCLALPGCFGFLEKLYLVSLELWSYQLLKNISYIMNASFNTFRWFLPFGSRQLSIFWMIMTEEHKNF
jgi:hypothetical protein